MPNIKSELKTKNNKIDPFTLKIFDSAVEDHFH